jgi:hypothetical protein
MTSPGFLPNFMNSQIEKSGADSAERCSSTKTESSDSNKKVRQNTTMCELLNLTS